MGTSLALGGNGDIPKFIQQPKRSSTRFVLTRASGYRSVMPRTARTIAADICYHVLNRGNGRSRVFHDDDDFREFLTLSRRAAIDAEVDILAYCLMPNHYHFVMRPARSDGIAKWAHWLGTTFASRYHRRRGSSGRIWQGRFKVFPIQEDRHLLSVMRYVERNALQARLAPSAEAWPWGSLHMRCGDSAASWLTQPPIGLPAKWREQVNQPATSKEYDRFVRSLKTGTPFGHPAWVTDTARHLGLLHTLRSVGRPPKDRLDPRP